MIEVYETAIRAWVLPAAKRRTSRPAKKDRAWRSLPFGYRLLVLDTETTTDHLLRLLFGVFRLYENGTLVHEGILVGDSLTNTQVRTVQAYAETHGLSVYSRMEFSKKVFFPEVYVRGTVCCGFNLPFDLSRIAQKAGMGRGRNRRKFRLTLTDWHTNPAIYIESISGRAAFIGFAWKHGLDAWEKPYFKGRFLDLSSLANALTGKRFTLRRAAIVFNTAHRKSTVELGSVTPEALDYCRNDVLVTAELYEKLRNEYLRYPFASLENERNAPPYSVPITRLYSTASVAKATLRIMGFRPLFDGGLR